MTRLNPPDEATIAKFAAVIGEQYVLHPDQDLASYSIEPRGLYDARPALVLRPGSAREVAELLAIANQAGCAIVPQSGNTGLVGGQIADDTASEIVLSINRLTTIRRIDAAGNAIHCDAGVVLKTLQDKAAEADRLFPLSLGAEGSCLIGGNLSSNAGGVNVLAYGNARNMVLGLEVALPDGRLWDGMRALRKDNTGYDLKNLFIGAEGTLGIITGCVLKLFPKPTDIATALCGVDSPDDALALLQLAQAGASGKVTGFEFWPRFGMELVLAHGRDMRDPFAKPHDWYVLIKLESSDRRGVLDGVLEALLSEAIEAGIVADAVPARSEAQATDFWRLRETLPEVQKRAGASIKHDIAVPVSAVPEFIATAHGAVQKVVPGARPLPFGHLGDGNVHYNVNQPEGMDAKQYLARWDDMNDAVFAVVRQFEGSISAEHGIGRMKANRLADIKSDVELDLMKKLKALFDPNGIMNPGRVLPGID
jgi:FAD/FMN-containing dehydrogenase